MNAGTRKKRKETQFFCEYGFLERTQTKTPKFNWNEFYTAEDKANLKAFRERVTDFIQESAASKVSNRLGNKIKQQKPRVEYVSRSDEECETSDDESESEQSDFSEESEESVRPRLRARGKRKRADSDTPETPRKQRITKDTKATKVTRTPSKKSTPQKSTTIRTPGSRSYRVQAPLEVTPLPSRVRDLAHELNLSPHQLARQRLHVAEVPLSLPCREKEYEEIFSQVESAILENESALIYVSGTPGTGKTATVREVIRTLQQNVDDGELFPFKFVEINGMKLPDPTQAYSRLWETLTGQRVTAAHALSLLQTEFTTSHPSRMPCVVLMDELDQLTTTKQEVMYNFFQWPNMPSTRLIVIAVANTMDLPERTLAHKVSSRLGLTRIAFPAYTRAQLREIITSRLSNVDSIDVEDAAIDYACLRVSRVSGDARRALDICRRAFELAEPGFTSNGFTSEQTPTAGMGRITMKIMTKAFVDMDSLPLQVYLAALPFAAKIFLKALMCCTRRSGLTETSLGDIIEDATRICKVNTNPSLDLIMGCIQPYGFVRTADDLAQGGILYLEHGRGERSARVRLRVSETDVLASWSEDIEFSKIT